MTNIFTPTHFRNQDLEPAAVVADHLIFANASNPGVWGLYFNNKEDAKKAKDELEAAGHVAQIIDRTNYNTVSRDLTGVHYIFTEAIAPGRNDLAVLTVSGLGGGLQVGQFRTLEASTTLLNDVDGLSLLFVGR